MSRVASVAVSILDVMTDVLGHVFSGESWSAWRVAMKAIFGLPMTDAEAELFRRCTGRQTPPTRPAREAWFVVGRRGGKSLLMALVAVYATCFRRYRLAPGERGVFMVIAADRRQARVVKRYIAGLLRGVPMLERLIANETKEAIELTTGLTIEIHTASFRVIRGYTVIGAVADEISFWPTEDSANPDSEILAALRPAMATVPEALLLVISSPYARRGELWETYERHFGREDSDVLVWQADTRTMNPTVPEEFIARAYDEDEAVASAEYGGEFRRDVERLLTREAISAVVVSERRELAPRPGVEYTAFADPSGGSADAMTLAIAHRDPRDKAVLDAIRVVRPPFSPESVVNNFAETLRAYRCREVVGDAYGGEWPREVFRRAGITYKLADQPRSDLFRAFVPLVNAERIELLDNAALEKELIGLERRTSKTGREQITHGPRGHDDIANAVAGACVLAKRERREVIGSMRWGID